MGKLIRQILRRLFEGTETGMNPSRPAPASDRQARVINRRKARLRSIRFTRPSIPLQNLDTPI